MIGRVRAAAAHRGEIVALATADLRVEHAQQRHLQALVFRQVEPDLVRIDHPVQVAPDFAAVDVLRAVGFRQLAQRLDHFDRHADVGGVLVGKIVRVDHLRFGRFQDRQQIIDRIGVRAALDR